MWAMLMFWASGAILIKGHRLRKSLASAVTVISFSLFCKHYVTCHSMVSDNLLHKTEQQKQSYEAEHLQCLIPEVLQWRIHLKFRMFLTPAFLSLGPFWTKI